MTNGTPESSRTATATAAWCSGLTPGSVSTAMRKRGPSTIVRSSEPALPATCGWSALTVALRIALAPVERLNRLGQLLRVQPSVDIEAGGLDDRIEAIGVEGARADVAHDAARDRRPGGHRHANLLALGRGGRNDRVHLAADVLLFEQVTGDTRPDVLEEEPIEDRPHPGLADVFFELRLERMPFEDQLGDRTGLDAIIERNRLVVVARLTRAADADFIEAAIVIVGRAARRYRSASR